MAGRTRCWRSSTARASPHRPQRRRGAIWRTSRGERPRSRQAAKRRRSLSTTSGPPPHAGAQPVVQWYSGTVVQCIGRSEEDAPRGPNPEFQT
eukprot:2860064-Pyramimonas_sp.AAC.1